MPRPHSRLLVLTLALATCAALPAAAMAQSAPARIDARVPGRAAGRTVSIRLPAALRRGHRTLSLDVVAHAQDAAGDAASGLRFTLRIRT